MRLGRTLLLGAMLGACTTPRTEILVVTDTDFAIPGELDAFEIDVTGPGGATQSSTASLGSNELAPPRTLGLVYDGGRLGPYRVRVRGTHLGIPVIERTAEVTFEREKTLALHIDLTRDCLGVSCGADQTCEHGACRSVVVSPDELTPFDGQVAHADAATSADAGSRTDAGQQPDAGSRPDAGCGTLEECNGADDDCDGAIDETFDLSSDPSHCGSCSTACSSAHATPGCSAGTCTITACESGFDDCDGNPSNGCESDLTSAMTCGSCATQCRPPARDCCAGTCQNGC